ncbi:hypothetical protein [Alteribacter natronophilus]|uniref:hypothetical protein n=1 Tax=Alteribacter natronophilus TaxID=2583810 RepID=UPI00110E3FC1|nr:hypothetical protein [Alteribacter natronophilus]TMW71086.1 hypothetical protein FGB90_14050 [Alteribacter natronophilus]
MDYVMAMLSVLFWVVAFAAVVLGITFILWRFIDNRVALATAVSVIVAGFGGLYLWTHNTTFDDLHLSDGWDDSDNIRSMRVDRYLDPEDDGSLRAQVRIEDKEVIRQVIEDFKGLRLRESRCYEDHEYYVYINNRLVGQSLPSFSAGESCFSYSYTIRDPGRDHLRTLDRLAEDESLEWEYMD